jgi:hypothetical protein
MASADGPANVQIRNSVRSGSEGTVALSTGDCPRRIAGQAPSPVQRQRREPVPNLLRTLQGENPDGFCRRSGQRSE